MLYITGDVHGEITRFVEPAVPSNTWTQADTLIVAGDFGCIFGLKLDEQKLDFLESLPYEIAFLDGNHECFPKIYAYPEETWRGGKVHRVRHNVRHLMRGQIFEMEGLRMFTMGGGYSIDVGMRIPGRSWWPEEMPSREEYEEGLSNLEKAGNQVDFILSHAAPIGTMNYLREIGVFQYLFPQERPLGVYLEQVAGDVSHRHFYFGHIHMDRELPDKRTALYHAVYCLNTGERIL